MSNLSHEAKKRKESLRAPTGTASSNCRDCRWPRGEGKALPSQSDEVPKKPEPEVEHSPPRIANLLLIDLRQETGAHVVRDLRGQVLLQESLDLRGINFRNCRNGNLVSRQQMLMRVAHGSERGCGADALNM